MVLIISWNVAGFSTTIQRISETYHNDNNHESALDWYFGIGHAATIVCLQEHKIPASQLTNRAEPKQAAHVPGYESFWSCCYPGDGTKSPSADVKKGFNGVVTYAKVGTVRYANATSALRVPHLDRQGRCVLTDHGSFSLWNVYVPASGMSEKMQFLKALRVAMQERRRSTGKGQILVGDLNIAHTARDVHWMERMVRIDAILREVNHSISQSGKNEYVELPQWKFDLFRHWPNIQNVLETKTVLETTTMNSITGEKYCKFRLSVDLGNKKRIFLGRHEKTAEECLYYFDFSEQTYTDLDTGELLPSREKNAVSIATLHELMSKVACVTWDDFTLRSIASTEGLKSLWRPHRQWLTDLLEEDDMVDVFRHLYPNAEGRFTCWDQFTNQRYVNRGVRLDCTVIDRSLLEHLVDDDESRVLRCYTGEYSDPCGEEAALRVVTANGLFQPASFEGGGIVNTPVTKPILDTQFGSPHTGMIYTPPSYSDHIAVSLCLKHDLIPDNIQLDTSDAATRKAQPQKKQQSLAMFVVKGTGRPVRASAKVENEGGSNADAPSKKRKVPVNSILHHFSKLEK